jgi:hypothetical protein
MRDEIQIKYYNNPKNGKFPIFKVTTEIATALCGYYDFYKIIDTFK